MVGMTLRYSSGIGEQSSFFFGAVRNFAGTSQGFWSLCGRKGAQDRRTNSRAHLFLAELRQQMAMALEKTLRHVACRWRGTLAPPPRETAPYLDIGDTADT